MNKKIIIYKSNNFYLLYFLMENIENNNNNITSIIKYFKEKINSVEQAIKIEKENNKSNSLNIDLKNYINLEIELTDYINNLKISDEYEKHKLLKFLYNILLTEFEDNNISRTIIIYNIENIFYNNIIPFFQCTETIMNLKKEKNNIEEEKNINFYKNICKIELNKYDKFILNHLNENLKKNNIFLEKIPLFLLRDVHKLLKQKIFLEWSLNYNIEIKTFKLQNTKNSDFTYLYERFMDFYDDRMTLFDLKFLNNDKEYSSLIIKALYYSNFDYLKYSCNFKVFINNCKRYLFLLGFNENEHGQILKELLDSNNNVDNNEDDIKDIMKTIMTSLINKIIMNKEGKIYLYIIFCMSMALNNIAVYNKEENKIVFSPLLKCSAKEKIFLKNFLINLDKHLNEIGIYYKNTSIYYNSKVENYVFAFLTKSYTKVLYDEQNRLKISIEIEKILMLNEKLNKRKNINGKDKDTQDIEDVNDTFDFNTLDDIECDELYKLYKEFKTNYIKLSNSKNNNNNSKVKNIFLGLKKQVKKSINKIKNKLEGNDHNIELKIIKQTPILIPIDKINTATHICICISSGEEENNLEKNMFYNIINYKNYQTIDYYIYNWKNEIQESVELYGKLLAYIISGREIFKFHTISLLGISYGCKIIKRCLKEMANIYKSNVDDSDLLQNVIFINGKVKFNFNKQNTIDYLSLISGNVINIHQNNNQDIIIPEKYKNNKNIFLPNIINYDFLMDFHIINSEYYILELNKILNKIKTLI